MLADLADAVLLAIPRFIYRALDSLWHPAWLNIPIVVVACVIVAIILTIVVSWIQKLIVRALGPDSALGAKLDELQIIGERRGAVPGLVAVGADVGGIRPGGRLVPWVCSPSMKRVPSSAGCCRFSTR